MKVLSERLTPACTSTRKMVQFNRKIPTGIAFPFTVKQPCRPPLGRKRNQKLSGLSLVRVGEIDQSHFDGTVDSFALATISGLHPTVYPTAL